jgi:hypothetical protein
VLQIGQAAGAAAVLSIESGVPAAQLDVRMLQDFLLESGFILMPYMDATQDHWAFNPIQRVGLSGIMRGEGIPVAWANETRFYPENVVYNDHLLEILSRSNKINTELLKQALSAKSMTGEWTVENGLDLFEKLSKTWEPTASSNTKESNTNAETHNSPTRSTRYDRAAEFFDQHDIGLNTPLTRSMLAVLIDTYLDPYNAMNVQIGYPNSQL